MTNKEAIYIINNRLNTYYCTDEDLQALDLAIKALEERPQGEWIEDSGNIACSHCHTIWLYRKTDFCPHCGADMREEDSV